MRLLYLILRRIQLSDPLTPEDVKMPSNEFEQALRFFAQHGYLNEVHQGMNRELPPKRLLTQKGMEFVNEQSRFASEMPADRELWPHWVRFQGEKYVPPRQTFASRQPAQSAVPDYDEWRRLLQQTGDVIRARGGTVQRTVLEQAATEPELAAMEKRIGQRIPASLRECLGSFSKRAYFSWHDSDGMGLRLERTGVCEHSGNGNVPDFEYRDIASGGFFDDGLWDLGKLEEYEDARIDNLHLDEEGWQDYWQHSFLFSKDGAGSYMGIDLKYNPGEVIYLSGDRQMHGWRLGADFLSFMDNWIRIGCAGHFGEDFLLFSSEAAPYVDHRSANSRRWTAWLGLE